MSTLTELRATARKLTEQNTACTYGEINCGAKVGSRCKSLTTGRDVTPHESRMYAWAQLWPALDAALLRMTSERDDLQVQVRDLNSKNAALIEQGATLTKSLATATAGRDALAGVVVNSDGTLAPASSVVDNGDGTLTRSRTSGSVVANVDGTLTI